jgi:hypothetical protein
LVSKVKRAHTETGLNNPVFSCALLLDAPLRLKANLSGTWHPRRQIGMRALSRRLVIYFMKLLEIAWPPVDDVCSWQTRWTESAEEAIQKLARPV